MDETLLAVWRYEAQQPFEGWDFSAFKDRFWWTENQPWSYMDRAAELMRSAQAVLDLDTGGGERLLELRPHWPQRVCATESYAPNFKLASQRLSPYGVTVVDVASDERVTLPFAEGEFDLVINRHGGLNVAEIARVLMRSGTLYTQQVHGQNLADLTAALGATVQYPNGTPEYYVPQLNAAGMSVIDVQETRGELHFADVAAIVAYLRAIPWVADGFNVDTHAPHLFALQAQLDAGKPLVFSTRMYVIEARKA